MTQPTLFDPSTCKDYLQVPTAPASIPEPERGRLSRQCQAILERLRQGTATNAEIAGIALKYTSRLSDLRKAGYDVRVKSRDYETGLTVYELREAR